jgi:hypothetical protein
METTYGDRLAESDDRFTEPCVDPLKNRCATDDMESPGWIVDFGE